MSLSHDLDLILDVVKRTDPSFSGVDMKVIETHIEEAKRRAAQNANDLFLLAAMRLLALAGNGHTRLIPNDAISVLPLRFVSIGRSVFLTRTAGSLPRLSPSKLISVNGVSVDEIERAADPLLAGTRQRKRVIGPILFAWPAALTALGVAPIQGQTEYRLERAGGETTTLAVSHDQVALASDYYPRNEHGKADPVWRYNGYVDIDECSAQGVVLKLRSFFDPDQRAFPEAIARAALWVHAHRDRFLLIDLRGNTGGNFLATMPLIDAISENARKIGCAVLVDKFTFSAAIVFVAILKYRLGQKLKIIGEEMGDALRFFAEGGLIELPTSGAVVRYSSALHDWETGSADQTTPTDIARQLVPVQRLAIDREWQSSPFDGPPEHSIYQSLVKELAHIGP